MIKRFCDNCHGPIADGDRVWDLADVQGVPEGVEFCSERCKNEWLGWHILGNAFANLKKRHKERR